jgi:hypothetical protein
MQTKIIFDRISKLPYFQHFFHFSPRFSILPLFNKFEAIKLEFSLKKNAISQKKVYDDQNKLIFVLPQLVQSFSHDI